MGTDRIREIVLSLKNFSRLDQAEFKRVDIHEGIDSTLLILGHRLKPSGKFPGIEIIKTYGEIPPVECHPGQLNQVFMNILANAIDALEASWSNRQKSGIQEQSTISSAEAQLHVKNNTSSPPSSFSPQPTLPHITIQTQQVRSHHVQIRIADNGPGISGAVQVKLFDPFFTTKEVGKGTGLGLSISYQIITERHRGSLTCQSELGHGTEFFIEIPLQQNNQGDHISQAKSTGKNGAKS